MGLNWNSSRDKHKKKKSPAAAAARRTSSRIRKCPLEKKTEERVFEKEFGD